MAKIIYKEGCEGQNKLSCIEGIEFDLLNGQKALIYPKYAEREMLTLWQINKWDAHNETEVEALKVEDTYEKTVELFDIGSSAAEWVVQFRSEKHHIPFCLPSLIAALEIGHQKKEIDDLAETIEGADLLRDFTSSVWSCSRYYTHGCCWCANGYSGYTGNGPLNSLCLVVPTILYG